MQTLSSAEATMRLLAMTLPGRETPELPAEALNSDIEILALRDFAQDRRLPEPTNLGRAVLTMAILGGYLNRGKGRPPGRQEIWEGYTGLDIAAQTYERLLWTHRASGLYQQLCSE